MLPDAPSTFPPTISRMRIESISRGTKDALRVTFSDETTLRVTEDERLSFGLYEGREIDADELARLRKAAASSSARALAARMIGARALSRAALIKKLSQKGVEETDAIAAADWLGSIGALDDASYAAALVRRCSASGYGAARAKDELYRALVPRELWDEALAQLDDGAETIEKFAAAKLGGRAIDEKAIRRVRDALLRRGFSWEQIRPVLSRYRELPE